MGLKSDFLQKAIDLFPDAVIVIDQKGTIATYNKEALRLFGYEDDELTGKDSAILIPNDFNARHKALIKEFFNNPARQKKLNAYKRALTKDKHCIDIELSIGPCGSDAQRLALLVFHNVTGKVETERRILENYKHLKAINLELEKFAHVISHDLKAPLNRISSLSHLLIHEIGSEKRKEIESITNYLENSIESVKNLIYGILEYSKAEDSEENGEGYVNLYEIFEECKKLVSIPDNFTIEMSADLPSLQGNKTKILQIFLNLISNAIKYNDKDRGELYIYAKPHSDQFHELIFDDNGPGVESKRQTKIFQLFERAEKPQNPNSHGLGLSIIKRIIEQKGGKIWCQESPMGGASFRFTWPNFQKKMP